MFRIHVERVLAKDIDTIFEALSDHARYDRFPGVDKSLLVEEGKDEKNGTGALRIIGAGRLELTERITQFARPSRMDYRIERSSPFSVQHTKGEVVLQPEGERTRVTWISEGHVQVPLLGRVMDRLAERSFSKAFSSLLKGKTSSGRGGVIGWGNYGSAGQVNAFRTGTNETLTHYGWSGEYDIDFAHAPSLLDGMWHHVAATYDSATSTKHIFYDGLLVGSKVVPDLNVFGSDFSLGKTYGTEYFQGLLDDVRVYDAPLSAAQIMALATATVSVPEPPTFLLFGFSLAVIAFRRRSKR
ncbi:LamG-like jellyroll fold domain-containing protein [Marinobacter metalliresistant]|uniref:SRPBCC family protein n=1 Tax=Marinobacter metalliresistant TaxID=2961995 RepID=A0ABZ2W715_9GAMM